MGRALGCGPGGEVRPPVCWAASAPSTPSVRSGSGTETCCDGEAWRVPALFPGWGGRVWAAEAASSAVRGEVGPAGDLRRLQQQGHPEEGKAWRSPVLVRPESRPGHCPACTPAGASEGTGAARLSGACWLPAGVAPGPAFVRARKWVLQLHGRKRRSGRCQPSVRPAHSPPPAQLRRGPRAGARGRGSSLLSTPRRGTGCGCRGDSPERAAVRWVVPERRVSLTGGPGGGRAP